MGLACLKTRLSRMGLVDPVRFESHTGLRDCPLSRTGLQILFASVRDYPVPTLLPAFRDFVSVFRPQRSVNMQEVVSECERNYRVSVKMTSSRKPAFALELNLVLLSITDGKSVD